jgi:hypothetical protein
MIQNLKKTSLFDMIFFKRDFWAKGWSVVGMGYSQKVKGSSFPMALVSLMDNPLRFSNQNFTIYQSFGGP